ncbi:hypothetical protein B4086_5595 [Bacillus cereus]|nr:hypothetical protein B4086_5595 [Bacillus cereus]
MVKLEKEQEDTDVEQNGSSLGLFIMALIGLIAGIYGCWLLLK